VERPADDRFEVEHDEGEVAADSLIAQLDSQGWKAHLA